MQSYQPPKSWEFQLWEFWDSHLGVPGQKCHLDVGPWPSIEYIIRGKVVASPNLGRGESCESEFAYGSS
jgi:hypothetical protein